MKCYAPKPVSRTLQRWIGYLVLAVLLLCGAGQPEAGKTEQDEAMQSADCRWHWVIGSVLIMEASAFSVAIRNKRQELGCARRELMERS